MTSEDVAAPGSADVVHLVAPASLDDPRQPSGGNVYDRELADALRASGQPVLEHHVHCAWSGELGRSERALDALLDSVPVGATVLVDGLLGLGAPGALRRQRARLRIWLIVHLPLALSSERPPSTEDQERSALEAVTGVIVTSSWTRQWLVTGYGVEPARIHVARPGAHRAEPSGADAGTLLCVAAVVPGKGQHLLVRALADIRDLPWSCRFVGPLDRDPGFVRTVRRQVRAARLGDRITFAGALPRTGVAAALRSAGLLVLPSRLETYGMVLTEALAHGVPVVATDAGGVAEAVGHTSDGRTPGVLVPPGDVTALGGELRRWLCDPAWRRHLQAAARARRRSLPDWSDTAATVRSAIGAAP